MKREALWISDNQSNNNYEITLSSPVRSDDPILSLHQLPALTCPDPPLTARTIPGIFSSSAERAGSDTEWSTRYSSLGAIVTNVTYGIKPVLCNEHSERQEILQVGGFGCPKLCLYGVWECSTLVMVTKFRSEEKCSNYQVPWVSFLLLTPVLGQSTPPQRFSTWIQLKSHDGCWVFSE